MTKKEIWNRLDQSKFVLIDFRTEKKKWRYKLDHHKVWRTDSPDAPNSVWAFELAEIIHDQITYETKPGQKDDVAVYFHENILTD